MESNMVGASERYVSQILTFVESHLIGFDVNDSNFYGPFFAVVFSNHAISVKMSGDVGGFETLVTIEDESYTLWKYDSAVKNMGQTNIENINSQLEIVKDLIQSFSEE
ncbi:MAG: hypothetical protein P8P80_01480 [Crocinitomicaceae bacterium]|nr:hypothetical protein [Crocinitomicaceae bacterium]MDG1735706.1 hypothetical protein [Crocinitomicaceae bacterium]